MMTKNMKSERESCSVKLSSLKDAESCGLHDSNDCEDHSVFQGGIQETIDNRLKDDDFLHILTGMYAEIFIVIVAACILTELFHSSLPLFYIQDYIFLFLLIIGILLLIGAFSVKFHYRFLQEQDEIEGQLSVSTQKTIMRKYLNDIHIVYKFALSVFGSAAILASILEIVAIFISPEKCVNFINSSLPVLRCVFIFFQMCFIWHSREILRIWGCIKDIALMHLFATNAAMFNRFLFWESAKDWEDAAHVKHNSSIKFHDLDHNITIHSLESNPDSSNISHHFPTHRVYYTSHCFWRAQNTQDIDVTSVQYCLKNSTVGMFWDNSSHVFYPFICQYYLIITFILYVTWAKSKQTFAQSHHNFTAFPENRKERKCNRSTKGLFLGLNVLISTIIIIIMFFCLSENMNVMLRSIYCVIFISSSFSAILGFFQVKKLGNWKSNQDIEYIKLFQNLGLLAVFVTGSYNVVFGSLSEIDLGFLVAVEAVSMVIHGIVQYIFLVSVVKKRVDVSNVNEKPGRQAVMYLLLCNVSLWLLDSFVAWNYVREYYLYTFGHSIWPVTRFMIPFLVFFRFHSFVILSEVWVNTYT